MKSRSNLQLSIFSPTPHSSFIYDFHSFHLSHFRFFPQTRHSPATPHRSMQSSTMAPAMLWHLTNIHKFSVIITTIPRPQRQPDTAAATEKHHSPLTADQKSIIIRKTTTISEASPADATVLIRVGNVAAAVIGQHSMRRDATEISKGLKRAAKMPVKKRMRATRQRPSRKSLMKVGSVTSGERDVFVLL